MFVFYTAVLFLTLTSIWIMDVILKRVFGKLVDKANYFIIIFAAIVVLLVVPKLMLGKFGWFATYLCCLIFTYIVSMCIIMLILKKTGISGNFFAASSLLKKLKCDIEPVLLGDNLMNERFGINVIVQKDKEILAEKYFGKIFKQAVSYIDKKDYLSAMDFFDKIISYADGNEDVFESILCKAKILMNCALYLEAFDCLTAHKNNEAVTVDKKKTREYLDLFYYSRAMCEVMQSTGNLDVRYSDISPELHTNIDAEYQKYAYGIKNRI
ncbi:MAG: hypothetical protein WCV63_10480 [Negativicutes bacterium]|jgi:hypothetical protein